VFGAELDDPETGRPKTTIINLINVNSPMTYDATMLGAAKVYARANQATIITPFILAGAMSPVTVAGTIAQTLAEALGGHGVRAARQSGRAGRARQFRLLDLDAIRRADLRHAGAGARAVFDGRARAPPRRAVPLRRQPLRLEDPRRASGVRIGEHLLPTCLAGVNFVLHTAGWLEGGLAMGYEKFVMDVDQAGMMHTLLAGVDLSPNGQALDAMREVGPGKHFLGCAHTQANFENAFYRSPLADNNSYEQWEAEGATDMAKRANALWKKQLAEYVEPPMDAAIDEALLEYIAKRKAASPDSNV
jgi:trimethylamine---corrinoid protein Co-methyltransferase